MKTLAKLINRVAQPLNAARKDYDPLLDLMETLLALGQYLDQQQRHGKIVVWSHNLHVGDSRASEMGKAGRISLGQLARERYGKDAVLIGFTTDSGTVTAALDWWDSPPQRVRLKPSLQDSYEAVFHQADYRRFLLNLREENEATFNLRAPRLERSIGVIYRPAGIRARAPLISRRA